MKHYLQGSYEVITCYSKLKRNGQADFKTCTVVVGTLLRASETESSRHTQSLQSASLPQAIDATGDHRETTVWVM